MRNEKFIGDFYMKLLRCGEHLKKCSLCGLPSKNSLCKFCTQAERSGLPAGQAERNEFRLHSILQREKQRIYSRRWNLSRATAVLRRQEKLSKMPVERLLNIVEAESVEEKYIKG